MLFRPNEKGQGLVEFALLLILTVIIVLGLLFTLVVKFWPAIKEWGAGVIADIQQGDPTAIFVAVVVLFLLWLFFGRRR